MAVIDASHPDIYDFVTTKADSPSELSNFNLSVGVTDAFLRAVIRDGPHRLVNPRTGKTVARMPAAELFGAICEAAHACGDPGLVFLDTINRANPVPGRWPNRGNQSVRRGSVAALRVMQSRFDQPGPDARDGRVNWDRLAEVTELAVRFLDDVIEVSRYPFPELG